MNIDLLQFTIKCDAPVAIGAASPDGEIDLMVTVDGAGRPYVPASSIAGSIRSHLRSHEADERLMGSRPPFDGSGEEDTTRPSPLRILGTEVLIDDKPASAEQLISRARTAIDQRRGAAKTTSFRQARLLPAGTIVKVYARVDEQLSKGDLALLASWQPRLGRGRSTGFGVCHLTSVGHGTLNLAEPDDLLRWLRTGGPALHQEVATSAVTVSNQDRKQPVISQAVRIVDGLAVGSGTPSDQNHRPVLRDGDTRVIEGSSIKGVLRSRAAFILRSIGGDACEADACGKCPVCELFGSTDRRGLISVDRVLIAGSDNKTRQHVALDRFSGGAHDRLLYNNELVTTGTFTLTVRPLKELPPWAEPLLRWCVRDLLDGLVGLGGLTTRGAGTVAVEGTDTIGTPPPLSPDLFAVSA